MDNLLNTITDVIKFSGHGFADGTKVVYSTAVGVGSTMPVSITGLTTYTGITSTSNFYQIIKLDNDSKFNQSTVKQKIDKFKETLDLVYMLKSDKDLSTYGIELPELQINNVLEKWEEETQSSL